MKTLKDIACISGMIVAAVLLIWITVAITGCMVIWTDHAFIATAFKTVDANDIAVVADPNGTKIGSGVSRTENDKLKVITPGLIGETK